jgi:hypothetical protein
MASDIGPSRSEAALIARWHKAATTRIRRDAEKVSP